jgi:uncharacterized protein YbcV (DUF1398 family)
MFTIDQIRQAHSKVKSGADFPGYVQEMKGLGVISYEHFVTDGHIQYFGAEGFTIAAPAKWPPREIAAEGEQEKLMDALIIHQQGQTDYPTFCKQAAETGVEKWIVNMARMSCVYYDQEGYELLAEAIPTP